ncbi:MAG: hypothetical protein N2517_08225 [Ignavibacteria bacterium]|nr:hypothetical protein [Ignavibacteria bacterium]
MLTYLLAIWFVGWYLYLVYFYIRFILIPERHAFENFLQMTWIETQRQGSIPERVLTKICTFFLRFLKPSYFEAFLRTFIEMIPINPIRLKAKNLIKLGLPNDDPLVIWAKRLMVFRIGFILILLLMFFFYI